MVPTIALSACFEKGTQAESTHPALDRRLDRSPSEAVPWMTFEQRGETPEAVMREATRDVARGVDEVPLKRLLEERRALIERWRRWAYLNDGMKGGGTCSLTAPSVSWRAC